LPVFAVVVWAAVHFLCGSMIGQHILFSLRMVRILRQIPIYCPHAVKNVFLTSLAGGFAVFLFVRKLINSTLIDLVASLIISSPFLAS